jgi:hypothetical protein
VPIDVVDALKVVEIEQKYRVRTVAAWRGRDGGFELLIEPATIWQAGQHVLKRKLARLAFCVDPPRHFATLGQKQTPGEHEKAHT